MSQPPDNPDDILISTTAAAILHDVKSETIRSWVRRGHLTPTTRDDDGMMWFLIQDVDRAEMRARERDVSGRTRKRLG